MACDLFDEGVAAQPKVEPAPVSSRSTYVYKCINENLEKILADAKYLVMENAELHTKLERAASEQTVKVVDMELVRKAEENLAKVEEEKQHLLNEVACLRDINKKRWETIKEQQKENSNLRSKNDQLESDLQCSDIGKKIRAIRKEERARHNSEEAKGFRLEIDNLKNENRGLAVRIHNQRNAIESLQSALTERNKELYLLREAKQHLNDRLRAVEDKPAHHSLKFWSFGRSEK